jgi:hypothetical protein
MGKGGGGGAPPNQQVTSTTTNLPEYAQPYFENLMQRGQAESYRQYQPYGAERLAGFTPGQIAAQSETLRMQTPGQFGAGTGMAGMGGAQSLQYGQGAVGTGQQALNYGGLGADIGTMGAQAGQQFFGMAQDPSSVQAFMSPYQQAVTDVARKAAIRDAQMAQQQINLGAVRQGTYGGARQALAQSERERGLLDRLGAIQAEGSQKAFEDARRTQQFGSDLGLRGLGVGLEGARTGISGVQTGLQGFGMGLQGAQQATQAGQTLGQLGQAQQESELKRLTAQEAVGGQQRGFEQQRLDQQYADFLRQRDYPLEQLGYFSNLLRGVPVGLSSTQTTSAPPPSIASQIGGLGLAGLGIAGAARTAGFAEGGEVDGPYMLQEPVDIAMEYGGNKQKIEQAAKMGLIDPTSAVMAGMFIDRMRNAQQEEMAPEQTVAQETFPRMAGLGATPQAAQMAQMAPQMPQQMPTEAGVAALPLSEDTFTAAGGGMIAFDDGGPVARFSAAGAVGGLPALQGSSGGYPLGIKALMAANPGMTLAQATRLLLGPAGAVATGGLMATQALMATDKGVGSDAAIGSGYDYGPEIMAGGQPDIPVEVTGPRGESLLLPRQQAMDPVTNKYVDVPPSARSPGLAGVLDKNTAPVAPVAAPTAAAPAAPTAAPVAAPPETDALVKTATQADDFASILSEIQGAMPGGKALEGFEKDIMADREARKAEKSQAGYMSLAIAGLNVAAGTSPFALVNLGKGLAEGLKNYADELKGQKKLDREDRKMLADINKARRDEARGNVTAARASYEKVLDRLNATDRQEIAAKASRYAADATRYAADVRAKDPLAEFLRNRGGDPEGIKRLEGLLEKASKLP